MYTKIHNIWPYKEGGCKVNLIKRMVLLEGERYPVNHVKNNAAFSFPFNSDDFTWLIWYISMNKMGLSRGNLEFYQNSLQCWLISPKRWGLTRVLCCHHYRRVHLFAEEVYFLSNEITVTNTLIQTTIVSATDWQGSRLGHPDLTIDNVGEMYLLFSHFSLQTFLRNNSFQMFDITSISCVHFFSPFPC